jgi:hypothetical protein
VRGPQPLGWRIIENSSVSPKFRIGALGVEYDSTWSVRYGNERESGDSEEPNDKKGKTILDRFYLFTTPVKQRPCAFLPTMAPVASSPTPTVAHLPAVAPTTAPKDKKAAARKRFEAVYTIVRDELLADFRRQSMPEEVIDYYRRVRAPNTRFPSGYDVPADHPIEYGLHRPRR